MRVSVVKVDVVLLFETEKAICVKSPFPGKTDIWLPKSLLVNSNVAEDALQYSDITLELSESMALEKELI